MQVRTEVFITELVGGKMKLVKATEKVLPIGSRVYGFLGYGGSASGVFFVYDEPNERGVQTLVEKGGYHRFHAFDTKCNKPISKKFGIGLYWDDIEPDYRISKDELRKLHHQCEVQKLWNERKERMKQQADERERQELVKQWQGILTPLSVAGNNYKEQVKIAKSNLLAYLSHKFKGTKFTACLTYGGYRVKWKNGASEREVREVACIFEDHTLDYSGDYHDYTPSNFNKVFGGFEYVMTERIEVEEQPKQVRNVQPIDDVLSEGVHIINYSERALAVVGDTKSIKDQLKALGGRFNPKLSCGAGWVFSKTKENELRKLLNL